MVHVEPEGYEADDVDDGSPDFLERELNEERALCGTYGNAFKLGKDAELCVAEFLKLHLCPELDEMHYEESHNHDAENEHVLRCPFNLGLAGGDGIAVIAAGGAVLDGEPHCVDDVDDEEGGETHRGDQGIPVGAEELADGVVGGGPGR